MTHTTSRAAMKSVLILLFIACLSNGIQGSACRRKDKTTMISPSAVKMTDSTPDKTTMISPSAAKITDSTPGNTPTIADYVTTTTAKPNLIITTSPGKSSTMVDNSITLTTAKPIPITTMSPGPKSVKLVNGYPYLRIGHGSKSRWKPICGHSFWDNNNGATTFCNQLGYNGTGYVTKDEKSYREDAYYVGRCDSDSVNDLVNGCSTPPLDAKLSCRKGNGVSVKITCEGSGAVRLVQGYPFLWTGSTWKSICGYMFSENHNGAFAFCKKLGYSKGGSITQVKVIKYILTDLYVVGRCDSENITDLENGCTKPKTHSSVSRAQYYCQKSRKSKKNKKIMVKISCYDPCPLGWTSLGIGCYRFLKAETYRDAFTRCSGEGGLLVGENSQYKQDGLSKFYKDSGISGLVWLGATDVAKEGEWKWSGTNQPMTFNSWKQGEPNNHGGNEDCVTWDGAESWNDVSCDWKSETNNALCVYLGNWGEWGSWSEMETCTRRCGGGKQRVKKSRSCNSPRTCRGESSKIIERDCNTHACKCTNKGTVAEFCTHFPQKISSEETRKFCKFDIDEKREALLCDQVIPAFAEILLNTVLESQRPLDCNYDPTEVLDGDCGQLLQDKLSKRCIDETCQAKQIEAQHKIDEVIEKTDKLYEEKIEEAEVMVYLIKGQKALLEVANKYKEYDDKQREIMKNVVDKLKDSVKLSQEAKDKLKTKAWGILRKDVVKAKTIKMVTSELTSLTKKTDKMKKAHTAIKNQFGKVKKHLKGMSKAEVFQKSTVALGHVLSSIGKFQKGDTMSVIGGVLDIANGIAQFLPPPASIVTGTLSTVFSMFQGEGAPSTEDVIKDEFKKQKEWMERKFNAIDKRFDGLSNDVKQGFERIEGLLEKHFDDLKKSINEALAKQTKEIKSFLLLKAVSDQARKAMGEWHSLEGKLAFIIDNEEITHSETAVQFILDKMIDFGKEAEKFDFRDFVKKECIGKSDRDVREYCQVLAFATLMMDRTSEIVITKTMALVGKSSLKTLDFTNVLQRRKNAAYELLALIFTSTKEEEFSYISCGLSDRSDANLSPEQKTNLFDYAAHLDPRLALTRKLELRQSCVDAHYTVPWLPVNGDDRSLQKEIRDCCKKGKKTEKKTCSPEKNTLNGGVDCAHPALSTNSLRCEGYISLGYCPGGRSNEIVPGTFLKQGDIIMSPNRRYKLVMQTDGNLILYRVKYGTAYWASRTNQKCTGCTFFFQTDGNLVLYDNKNSPTWSSGTNGQSADTLALKDDGILTLMKYNNPIHKIPEEYGTIVYKWTRNYDLIWTDNGSGGDHDVSIWKPTPESGYCLLGDVAVGSYSKPSTPALLVKRSDAVAPPTGFSQKWKDTWSGADWDGSFYAINAPSGFTCLGGAATRNHGQPNKNEYCCVKNKYVVKGKLQWTWTDAGSGARQDGSLWTIARGNDASGLYGGNFLPANGHSQPSGGYLLKGDSVTVIQE